MGTSRHHYGLLKVRWRHYEEAGPQMTIDMGALWFYLSIGVLALVVFWLLRRPIGGYRRSFRRNDHFQTNRDDGLLSDDGTRAGASLHGDEHTP
jgi:hypothetical protein